MRSPQYIRNNNNNNAAETTPNRIIPNFHSTVSLQKLRRFNLLILLFRLASFSFTLAAAVFMLTNSRGGGGGSGADSPRWYNFHAFRFVLAANSIVAFYSLFEMTASIWEISGGDTVFPEVWQVWFDFGHDQAFAYLLLSANAAGVSLARTLKETGTCGANNAFCIQTAISIALGFAGFLFIGFSALLSGFRVVCYLINGSRFHL